MKLRISKLKKEISQYDKIAFYGAGNFSRMFTEEVKKYGIMPDLYIVSEASEIEKNAVDIITYHFNQCKEILKDENICIIITVSEKFQKEIVNLLTDNDIINFYLMTDYIWTPLNRDSYENIYKKKTIDWYLNRISEWQDDEMQKSGMGNICVKKDIGSKENRIAFVVTVLEPRVIKIADELKREGKEVCLFISGDCKTAFHMSLIQELLKTCEVYYYWEYIEELLFLIIRKRPYVIHVFSGIIYPYSVCILMKLKSMLCPIVFENYDIGNGMYKQEYVEQYYLDKERYCIENADGVCCRGYEIDYLVTELKFQIKGKMIRFFDYCQNDDIFIPEIDDDKPLTLCYVGGITTEKEDYCASNACFLELGEMCKRNHCHLHIYPFEWDEERFSEYIELNKKNAFFHFHKPISFRKLKEEIVQYDYGIHPVIGKRIREDTDKRLTKNKYEYGSANKFFDYLDAGLPIIAGSLNRFLTLFEKENVLINWTIEEYDFEKMKEQRNTLRKNVYVARQKMKIANKIKELIEFYNLL